MLIREREIEGKAILDIEGDIDLYNAPEFKAEVNRLIEEGKYHVLVNMAQVSYIDSSGVGALITGMSNLKKYQGTLKITTIVPSVKKVFELTRLNTFFQIYETEEQALRSYE